jgi:catechol 2,3-dioxygenase-like lactoylglutathione lyase family enzyme
MIMAIASTQRASVRYLVDDVDRAVDFYATYLEFTLGLHAAPASAEVMGARCGCCPGPPAQRHGPIADGSTPVPGGENRIHLIVDDITAEVARPVWRA